MHEYANEDDENDNSKNASAVTAAAADDYTDLVSSATASASVLSGSRAFCMYFGASAVMPGIPDNVICSRKNHQRTLILAIK